MDITGIFSEAFWYIAPILVTMTTFLAGLFNQGVVEKFVPEQHRAWLKQLVAWVFGAGLSVGAWGLKVIAFGNPVWLGVIALCVVVGLASNGIYDIPFMRNWIETWFIPKTLISTVALNDNVAKRLNLNEEVKTMNLNEEVKTMNLNESVKTMNLNEAVKTMANAEVKDAAIKVKKVKTQKVTEE